MPKTYSKVTATAIRSVRMVCLPTGGGLVTVQIGLKAAAC